MSSDSRPGRLAPPVDLRVAAVVLAVTIWVVLAIGYFGLLVLEGPANSVVDLSCTPSASSHLGSSEYGFSTWTWLPPGKICHFADRTQVGPSRERTAVAAVVLAGGATGAIGLAVAISRRRPARDTRSLVDATPFVGR